ncbi:MAG TPA: heparan-alpha-glucosaminide N-acetyltransferase domain-containing protein [Ornithinibacter sp.]|nr:heparan-alpha-glucosaminide N-acetyltransferase domain-containing protein [Ornithinibacter sp.]
MSTTRESRAPSVSPQSGAVGGPRIVVPDVLRGVAILAMLIAHAVPFLPGAPSALNFLMFNINDVASPLFALVMGMSAQIVTQRTARAHRGRCCSSRS